MSLSVVTTVKMMVNELAKIAMFVYNAGQSG